MAPPRHIQGASCFVHGREEGGRGEGECAAGDSCNNEAKQRKHVRSMFSLIRYGSRCCHDRCCTINITITITISITISGSWAPSTYLALNGKFLTSSTLGARATDLAADALPEAAAAASNFPTSTPVVCEGCGFWTSACQRL